MTVLIRPALNNPSVKIQNWIFKWKMSSKPVRTKQAQKVMFLKKTLKVCHPNLCFNNQLIERSVAHKHQELTLDENLSCTN